MARFMLHDRIRCGWVVLRFDQRWSQFLNRLNTSLIAIVVVCLPSFHVFLNSCRLNIVSYRVLFTWVGSRQVFTQHEVWNFRRRGQIEGIEHWRSQSIHANERVMIQGKVEHVLPQISELDEVVARSSWGAPESTNQIHGIPPGDP